MSDTANPEGDTAVVDADGDSFRAVTDGGDDCNDQDATVHPGAPERCNLMDDDCDGTADEAGSSGGDPCPSTSEHATEPGGLHWTCAALEASVPGAPAAGLLLALFALLARRRR